MIYFTSDLHLGHKNVIRLCNRPFTDIEESMIDKNDAISIYKILHCLEEPYKEVFTLRVLGELSFKEISDIFGKNESWARVTYHRARLKIRELME